MFTGITKFSDEKDYIGPFNGVFLIFNIGRDNWRKIERESSEEYREDLLSATKKAIADGLATIYVYDTMSGTDSPPDHMDDDEDFVFKRLYRDLSDGENEVDFPLTPSERERVFETLRRKSLRIPGMAYSGKTVKVMGYVKMGDERVFFPETSIGR